MVKSAKAYRKHLAEQGIFYTDPKLAEAIRAHLPADVKEVYDPTCGIGNLLASFPDDVRKYGQELDAESAEEARKTLVNAEIVAGDTLTAPAFMGRKFDAIAANYPFSVAWAPDKDDPRFSCAPALAPKSKADMAFILHILYMLSDTGTASVLCSPGITFRGQAEGKIRRWLIEQNVIDSVTLYEGGYFEDTGISTVLLVLKKRRDKDTVTVADHEHGLSREVTRAEIIEADYNLSVGRYVEPPRKPASWEGKSVNELMDDVLGSSYDALKGTVEMEYHILTGLRGSALCPSTVNLESFLNKVKELADEYLTRIVNNKAAGDEEE